MKVNRRRFLTALSSLPVLSLLKPLTAVAARQTHTDTSGSTQFRLAFGSCAEHYRPQPIWDAIRATRPDVFAFIGDNIYADTTDMNIMRERYAELAAKPEFARFRSSIPIVATWDDHDYGYNDCGREYERKHESKEIFLDFFGEPAESPRREREGIYESYWIRRDDYLVQILVLDLRWFRDPLAVNDQGHYVPHTDTTMNLLGESQWRWLEKELHKPADLRIIASSTQFVADLHRWEKWQNFPHERERLLRLIDRIPQKNLVVISGDMHYGEISMVHTPGGYPVYDLTSSGLTRFESAQGLENSGRLALFDTGINFGLVTAEFSGSNVRVALEVRDEHGGVALQKTLWFQLN